MAYIVDGNNVMGQTPGWHRDRTGARDRLLVELASFARLKKTRVTAVFDGQPDPRLPDGSAFKGVRVLYAERGSNADSRIVRLVESSRNPRGLTVVTSDRHLAFTVGARGASVIRSGRFRLLMQECLSSAPRPEDGEDFELGDLDQWFRYFGALPEDDDLSG